MPTASLRWDSNRAPHEPLVLSHGAPLIGSRCGRHRSRVERAARVVGVEKGVQSAKVGRPVHADTIVWCTGFGRDYFVDSFRWPAPTAILANTGGLRTVSAACTSCGCHIRLALGPAYRWRGATRAQWPT